MYWTRQGTFPGSSGDESQNKLSFPLALHNVLDSPRNLPRVKWRQESKQVLFSISITQCTGLSKEHAQNQVEKQVKAPVLFSLSITQCTGLSKEPLYLKPGGSTGTQQGQTLHMQQLPCIHINTGVSYNWPISGGMDVKLFSPAPRYCKFFSNLERMNERLDVVPHINAHVSDLHQALCVDTMCWYQSQWPATMTGFGSQKRKTEITVQFPSHQVYSIQVFAPILPRWWQHFKLCSMPSPGATVGCMTLKPPPVRDRAQWV